MKNSLKRRKNVPLCYRKKSPSNSNTSLSQLLNISSYKKRINHLVNNNRSLAFALEDARCETAYQSDVIKNYARDHNKILFARLKLQRMAKTITQFITDLHEVVNYLDINWASENNLLQKNGPIHDKLKIKAPEVDGIEESVLSSKNGDCMESGVSCLNSASNEVFYNVEDITYIIPSTSENIRDVADDLEMPPILFIEDGKAGEKLTVERSSSTISANEISLTPKLDPDFRVVIIPSAPTENATPKKVLESTIQRKLSMVLMNHEESCKNKNPDMEECEKVSSSSDLEFEEYSSRNDLNSAFVIMKDRGSKNKNSSSPDVQYTNEHAVNVNFPNILLSEPVVLPASGYLNNNNIESDNTILPCEDKELTEIIRPVQLITSENSSNTAGYPLSHPDIQLNKREKKENNNMGVEKMHSEDKFRNVTEQISVLSEDVHLNMEEKSCDASINGVKVSVNESNKDKLFKTLSDKKDADRGPDTSPTKELQENKDIENHLSVYDLDVSNSKKPLKKSKTRSKPKNSSRNKETSEPLSQNCNITKLQGVNYKFTKNENLVDEQKHQLLQNDSFICETNCAIHTDKTVKRNQSYFTFDLTKLGNESGQSSTPSKEEFSCEMSDRRDQELSSKSPKSEMRRVSFASVDLVCNFNKMSVSKTIAGNKKTLHTSKSVVELDDFNQPSDTKNPAPLPSADNTSKMSGVRRKLVKSSAVLKDVANLEENPREFLKRRSKVVNYKEPNLIKKMRRP